MTHMHKHAADELRRRIGPDADALMHASGAGNQIALAMLERLGRVDAFKPYDEPGLTAFAITIDGQRWQGASLRIDDALPDTVTQAMVGQPLGLVVTGTPCDDRIVRTVSTSQDEVGHWITVDADMVDTDRLCTPGLAMRLNLCWETIRGYVAGRAWAGITNSMTDLVVTLVMLLAGTMVAMSLSLAMPDHVNTVLSVMTALFMAFMARPRRNWRGYVQDHVRGRRAD